MRVFLVIRATSFYHPHFLAKFLRETTDEVVGAALVTRVLPKNDLEHYLRENWRFLKPREMFKMAGKKYSAGVNNLLARICWSERSDDGPFYSVESVLQHFQIDYFEVEIDLNKSEYLDKMHKKNIDVLVNSNSLVLKQELLAIPKIGCLNRHCGLLPAYGGVWPVFQAYRRGERYTGVSVHMMTGRIDDGTVLAHKKVPICPSNTVAELYELCFDLSSQVVIEALDKLRNADYSPDAGGDEPSYYSFPGPSHWRQFRERGGRFI
jgi:methionyl-tRNA formyltransferase